MTPVKAPRCPVCRLQPITGMDPDERALFGLPEAVCRCTLAALGKQLAAEGWAEVPDTELPYLNRARVPLRIAPAALNAQPGGSTVVWRRFAARWVLAVTGNLALSDAMRRALLRRGAGDPELAAAANAAAAIGGGEAAVAMLLREYGAPEENEPVARSGR